MAPMYLFASFNGGPTEASIVIALLLASIAGVFIGVILRKPIIAFFFAAILGFAASSGVLFLGNKPGDAAGFALLGAIIIFGPICALLSGIFAVVAVVIMRLMNPKTLSNPNNQNSDTL